MRGLRTCTRPSFRLTLVGRALALIAFELLFNAACWVAAALCFGQSDGLLGLAMLAWTLGLRHGLDADHISAIDNATRQMVAVGQLPMTCGLWFSLGHSTIVIAVNVAIAISVNIYDKLEGVGAVGGIVGTAVSASFLFLVAVINSYYLHDALKHRRARKEREALGLLPASDEAAAVHGGGCLVRLVGPILKAVDRPWKLYPVGVLFGFGFDTASSIALLAISAIASRGPNGEGIAHGKIVVLPFIFTAGMSLVDTLDSILMLYAYAEPELRVGGRWRVLEKTHPVLEDPLLAELEPEAEPEVGAEDSGAEERAVPELLVGPSRHIESELEIAAADQKPGSPPQPKDAFAASSLPPQDRRRELHPDAHLLATKTATMSSLSISLTLLSIAVALSISLIEILGLIGENCAACRAAAEDPAGGGLAGSWWRAWASANDASGYVGAAIVGCFVAILVIYHGVRWGVRRHRGPPIQV